MPERIAVDFDVLARHAVKVDTVAADVATARSAARSISVGGGAFGIMCAFLVPPASIVNAAATSVIDAAHGMVARAASEVRALGFDFARLEDELVEQIDRLEGRLP